MTIVELIEVKKYINKDLVLNGVNITINEGEIIAVRGRSGVGKTTLAKIVALLYKPDNGSIIFMGKDVSNASDRVRSVIRLKYVGYIDQFFQLLPNINVLENVELPLKLMGMPKNKRRKRALELLSLLGLEDKAYKYPYELSGGERQRVAIARALVKKPILIVGDEILSNLDDYTAQNVMKILRRISKENKCGILITTTDLYRPLGVDKDLALINGKIREQYKEQ